MLYSVPASILLTRMQTRLKLRHMQALLTLYDLRSMGRAAQAMGMTQPAMSQLVADLERLLETPLFLRHSKGIDPTPAALDLLPVARRMIAATEEGAERIASRHRRDIGLVRVASTAAASGALLDRVLPAFAARHSAVRVQINTVIGPSLDAAFAGDEYDVVCCRKREIAPGGWTFVDCIEDELVPVCGASHPLVERDHISLDELGRQIWLQNHVSTVARKHFDDFARQAGWNSVNEVHIQSRSSLLIWTMLRDGHYISLVPRSVVSPWLAEGTLRELDVGFGLPLAPLGYLWRPETPAPATKHFVSALHGTGSGSKKQQGAIL